MGLINTYYFKSSNIKVFPCSFRGNYTITTGTYAGQQPTFDPEARLNTEFNMINAGGQLGSKQSYIKSWDAENKILICVIGGYYFEIYNVELTDFYNADTKQIKQLCIKTREIVLKSDTDSLTGADDIDSQRKTKVLASWTSGTGVLDELNTSTQEYYFTGIKVSDSDSGNAVASLAPIRINEAGIVVINYKAFLPEINCGLGTTTTANGTKITSLTHGENTSAESSNSIAIGKDTKSLGAQAVALGEKSIAFAANSVAEGYGTVYSDGIQVSETPSTTEGVIKLTTLNYGNCSITKGNILRFLDLNSNYVYLTVGNIRKTAKEVVVIESDKSKLTNLVADTAIQVVVGIAAGTDSHAEGKETIAYGEASHAEGNLTKAIGNYSHADGLRSIANKAQSTAIGTDTLADAENAVAIGNGTKATSTNSIAGGTFSEAAGNNSIAFGNSVKAKGICSVALGIRANSAKYAGGTASVTLGLDTKTGDTANYAVAIGNTTTADGIASLAAGNLSVASGTNAVAIGNSTTASGLNSVAMGENSEATEENTHAEGYATKAQGKYSHTEGNTTNATGEGAHAEGQETVASGKYAHAEGHKASAKADYTHAEGISTEAESYASHAEGRLTKTKDEAAHAEGWLTLASGKYSHAEGKGIQGEEAAQNIYNTASGEASHAEGINNTASGEGSHAEGKGNTVTSSYAHVEGVENKAEGAGAHAEGYKTKASGEYTHAEGKETYASQANAHAEGLETKASGINSHAEGYKTEAKGESSHAEGCETLAQHKGAHAEGYGTKTSADYQTVVGKYNKTNANALFIVGNGHAAEGEEKEERKNAFEVLNNGTVTIGNKTLDTIVKDIMLDACYPVGSYYISEERNESTISKQGAYGCPIYSSLGGKWERVKDTFLYAADDSTYTAGESGGSNDCQLIKHGHTLTSASAACADSTGLTSTFYMARGEYTRDVLKITANGDRTGTDGIVTIESGYDGSWPKSWTMKEIQQRPQQDHKPEIIKIDANHKHNVTITNGEIGTTGRLDPTVSGQEYKADDYKVKGGNMPKYKVVYIWRRIA